MVRNATAEEIQGEWQLLPLPDALQLKILSANPWPSECQFFWVRQVFVNIASDSGRRHEEGTTSPCRAQQQCYHDRSRRDHQE